MAKKATLQDVADYLQVSKSAVSHALSGRRKVSPELSRRLQKAVAELGYRPNFAARVLKSHSTGLVGVAVNELDNPHTVSLINELSHELKKSGYSLTLCLADSPEPEECRNLIRRISNGMVDAIINMLPQLSEEDAQAAADGTPILTYRRHKRSPIVLDYGYGIVQALDYLTGIGHERIGLISVARICHGEPDPREVAYRSYMEKKGTYDPALIHPGSGDVASSYDGMQAFSALSERPGAILAGNDLIASGVFQWAHENRLRLPEDLSVIGFDNSLLAMALYPRLTSIDMCAPRIATHTARVLLTMIDGQEEELPSIEIKPQLVLRDSCHSHKR